jgi:hypothetical protein
MPMRFKKVLLITGCSTTYQIDWSKHYEVIVIVIAWGLKYRRKIYKNVNEKQISMVAFLKMLQKSKILVEQNSLLIGTIINVPKET